MLLDPPKQTCLLIFTEFLTINLIAEAMSHGVLPEDIVIINLQFPSTGIACMPDAVSLSLPAATM